MLYASWWTPSQIAIERLELYTDAGDLYLTVLRITLLFQNQTAIEPYILLSLLETVISWKFKLKLTKCIDIPNTVLLLISYTKKIKVAKKFWIGSMLFYLN